MPKYSQQEIQDIQDRTEKIESERMERERLRAEKKKLKEIQQKRKVWEKLIAPILLVLTIFITFLIQAFWSK